MDSTNELPQRRGRPAGSTRIDPKQSAKRLEDLNFDPLQELVDMYDDIGADIANMCYDSEGNPRNYSQVALAQLVAIRQKVAADLLRYGYARQTEGIEVKNTSIAPMQFILTSTNKEFEDASAKATDTAAMKGPGE